MRLLLPLLLAVSGCASDADTVAAPAPSPSSRPATSLEVELTRAPGVAPLRWTLHCGPPGGDHPSPAPACEDLARTPAALSPLPGDRVCAQVFGGPQTAVVRGTHTGRPVRLALSRTDACRTAQWDALGAVLAPAGG